MRKLLFAGHKDTILDIQVATPSLIATCSDDKSIRLWDTRTSKAVMCIAGYSSEEYVNTIRFQSCDSNCLFGASDKALYGFDFRSNNNNLIVRNALSVFKDITSSDISCFALNASGTFALGDDDGIIHILNSQGEILKRLRRPHVNVIGCISFRPNNNNNLVSGGFDSLLCLHDYKRGRIQYSIDFSTLAIESGNQMSNPPFVHDITHMFQHRVVLSALGDGSLHLNRSVDLREIAVKENAHSGMVVSLAKLSDRSFASSGINGNICLWNIESGNLSISDTCLNQMDSIEHGVKINSICSPLFDSDELPSCRKFAVADISNCWTMYDISC
jgi:WD40 repeat protein